MAASRAGATPESAPSGLLKQLAGDVAFLIALHWSAARRRELELGLLHRYHERLLQLGVTGYAFDKLFLDYRRCVVRNLTFPILFRRRGMATDRWWYRLKHAIAAYQELDGDELL